jgi:hypothetical protein
MKAKMLLLIWIEAASRATLPLDPPPNTSSLKPFGSTSTDLFTIATIDRLQAFVMQRVLINEPTKRSCSSLESDRDSPRDLWQVKTNKMQHPILQKC